MAENLNYKTAGSFCYHDSTQYCELYGRFYTWASAMDSIGAFSANSKGCGSGTSCFPTFPVRGACPAGFHLPTLAEWKTLIATAGGEYDAASKLVSAKRLGTGFNWVDEGSDDYGFSALPAGSVKGYKGFYGVNEYASFWSSSEDDWRRDGFYVYMVAKYNYAVYLSNYGKLDVKKSVRCIMDGERLETR